MKKTGWEHHELEKEMANSNLAQLLELFKRESEKYTNKCVNLVENSSKLTEEGKKELENEASLLQEGKEKLAMEIAEMLTDTKKFQREVRPKR